jgi:large subunit ribosomal protein L6
MPVAVPAGVQARVEDGRVNVQGPKGSLALTLPAGVKVARADGTLRVERDDDVRLKERDLASRHGLTRALLRNMIEGVTQGYSTRIELRGAGFRPQVQGAKLVMTLGFSHPVTVELPAGIKAVAEKVETGGRGEERHIVTLSGCDKQLVGQMAANIRAIRKADVYKGKGIRYVDEVVRRKAGKAAATAAGGTGGK